MALREFTACCAREAPAAAGAARPPAGCGRLTARPLFGPWSRTPTEWDPGALPRPLHAIQAGPGYQLAGSHRTNWPFYYSVISPVQTCTREIRTVPLETCIFPGRQMLSMRLL